MAGASEGLSHQWSDYVPSYRTLAATGCAPPDVVETLHCNLSGDGTAEITLEVSFPDVSATDIEEADRERIEGLRQLYFEGWDPWAARFERAGQAGETLSWERVGGSLRSLSRSALLPDPGSLDEFFADTDLTVLFAPDPEESEFTIFAGSSSRATGEERNRLADLLAGWSRAAVAYLREVASLYDYLETNPDRAETIFDAIFGDYEHGLHDFEEERLDRLIGTFLEVLDIASQTDERGESLEHLARLVYDPFPAAMSVTVDGPVLSSEGFISLGDDGHEVPPLGLDRALSGLEKQWIEPPLLTTYERLERLGDDAAFDAREFAARPRRVAELPSARELADAVEDALAPAPAYQLRWKPSPGSETSAAEAPERQ